MGRGDIRGEGGGRQRAVEVSIGGGGITRNRKWKFFVCVFLFFEGKRRQTKAQKQTKFTLKELRVWRRGAGSTRGD